VANFATGGAGVNALAKVGGADLLVVDMGVAGDLSEWVDRGAVVDCRVGPGTRDISVGPAMSREDAVVSVEHGIRLALERSPDTDIFGTGEMGIGNTTPSAAICACVTGEPIERVTGRGTGIDDHRLQQKIEVVRRALTVNAPNCEDGLDVLAGVGGFEIGGIAGLILGAARERRPVVVDGFISTAGALIAQALCPAAADYMVLAHASAEYGHEAMCAYLGKRPLLDLDFRLGEGTGAALAMPLLEGAVRVLSEVATFSEAGVSGAAG
jgi:nicotinate-nucleotide--dimethylbenzimidazole phosphoribosyltransferase